MSIDFAYFTALTIISGMFLYVLYKAVKMILKGTSYGDSFSFDILEDQIFKVKEKVQINMPKSSDLHGAKGKISDIAYVPSGKALFKVTFEGEERVIAKCKLSDHAWLPVDVLIKVKK